MSSRLPRRNWIFSVTPESWDTVKAHSIWATEWESQTQKIKTGDIAIFYVTRTRPPCFMGIYKVASEWFQATKPLWPDEVEQGKILYPWQLNLKQIRLGTVNVKDLAPKLAFIGAKKNWQVYLVGTPANMKRPISEEDYQLIFAEMKKPPVQVEFRPAHIKKVEPRELKAAPIPSHKEIQNMAFGLGELEGYIVDKEVPVDRERLDVTWRRKVRVKPDFAFEVQKGGDFNAALMKLKEAWDLWGCTSILITTDEYIENAKRWLGRAFHEMEKDARIVHWQKIKEWHELMEKRKRIMNEIGI